MDHNKDIGDLLKDRLNNEKKSPNNQLWDRINTSLDTREKTRLRIMWYRFGVSALLVVALAAFFLLNGTKKQPESLITNTEETRTVTPKTNNLIILEKKRSTDRDGFNTISDKKIEATTIDNNSIEIATKTAEIINSTTHKTKEKNSVNLYTNKDSILDDGYAVTTTYSYYISELDTTLVATNKAEMDRKVRNAKKLLVVKDSLK